MQKYPYSGFLKKKKLLAIEKTLGKVCPLVALCCYCRVLCGYINLMFRFEPHHTSVNQPLKH